MVQVENYANLIRQVMEKHSHYRFANAPALQLQLVVNESATQFVLITVGWQDGVYTHYVVFHIECKGDKVWLHENRTDSDIAAELVEAGIPKSQIVLGFVELWARPASGYALN